MRALKPGTADDRATERAISEDVSGTVATGLNILEQWDLAQDQQCAIPGIAERSLYQWKHNPPARLGGDALERLSWILGIWRALGQLFPSRDARKRWPHLENSAPPFGGRPPIERMASGRIGDLHAVYAWLGGWRGWRFRPNSEHWFRQEPTGTGERIYYRSNPIF